MTIQFPKQSIAALSDGLPKVRSGLVRRLVCARDDPGKERIRKWLIDLDDAQLKSGLGLTVEDIAVLRTGTCKAWRAGVNPAQHGIVDARTSRYAETDARWQRDPEGIAGVLRAKGVSA
jgi:hypothetical protein